MPWPPQGIYAKKEINQVADMKGLSWRVYNAGTQRIAEIVGAYPVTIQAADLPQALATGLINAFMTSSATGYDSKAWETMSYFYDTQAWIPKNVTFVNKAAFEALDKPTQEARAQGGRRRRGARLVAVAGQDQVVHRAARRQRLEGAAAEQGLKAGLQQIGERLTGEWLLKAGADGRAVIDAYRKKTHVNGHCHRNWRGPGGFPPSPLNASAGL